MMRMFKSIWAIFAGIIAGSILNAAIILLCSIVFGVPEGMILWDEESVRTHADKLTTANIAGTLVAHQLGTLAGAFVAAKITPLRKMIVAVVTGLWFLGCGIYAASLIPAPLWFIIADISLYLPVAITAGKLAEVFHIKKIKLTK